jgi:hypothetical protein
MTAKTARILRRQRLRTKLQRALEAKAIQDALDGLRVLTQKGLMPVKYL